MTSTEACIRCKEEMLNKYIFNNVVFPHEALPAITASEKL